MLMDEPTVSAVVVVNRLHTADAIRDAHLRQLEVGKKRRRAKEKSKEKMASLKRCSNPACDKAMEGRKKTSWEQCSNVESLARYMNSESQVEEDECLYRVCGGADCLRVTRIAAWLRKRPERRALYVGSVGSDLEG